MLKVPGADLYQNACGVVNEQKIFCSHQSSSECSMNTSFKNRKSRDLMVHKLKANKAMRVKNKCNGNINKSSKSKLI